MPSTIRMYYIAGPSADDFERNTHERANAIIVVQRNKPGNAQVTGDRVSLYRPHIKEQPQQTQNFRPAKTGNLEEVRARHEKNNGGRNENPARDDSNNNLNPIDRVQPSEHDQKNNVPEEDNRKRDFRTTKSQR